MYIAENSEIDSNFKLLHKYYSDWCKANNEPFLPDSRYDSGSGLTFINDTMEVLKISIWYWVSNNLGCPQIGKYFTVNQALWAVAEGHRPITLEGKIRNWYTSRPVKVEESSPVQTENKIEEPKTDNFEELLTTLIRKILKEEGVINDNTRSS